MRVTLEIEADIVPGHEATNGIGIPIEPDAFREATEPPDVVAAATEASAEHA